MKSRSKKVSKSCGGNKSRQNKGKSKNCGGQKYRKSLGKRNSKRLGSLKKKAKKSNGRKRKHSNKRAKKQKGGYMLPTEYFGGNSKRFFEDAFILFLGMPHLDKRFLTFEGPINIASGLYLYKRGIVCGSQWSKCSWVIKIQFIFLNWLGKNGIGINLL